MNNPYLTDFLGLLQSRYSIDSRNMSVSEWVAKNTTLGRRPMSYDRYPFQKEILDDMHPSLSCKKCSQIGLTEIQIRKALAFLYRNQGTTTLYSMPSKRLRDVLSNVRVNAVLEQDKIFNFEPNQTRSVEQKQIGRSYLIIPVATEDAATSISADMVMVDEVDLTEESVLGLYNSRLQNSDFRIRQDFSTPSFEDFGIDAGYKSSDQREYMIKCGCCNHWQVPTFARPFVQIPGLSDSIALEEITEDIAASLDLLNAEVICERCRMPLDLKNGQREWVALRPEITLHRGYQVRPFSTDRLPISYIVAQLLHYKKRNYMRGWYNTTLGETFQDANTRLQLSDILACLGPREEVSDAELKTLPLFVGIDVGALCHVVIGTFSGFDRPRVLRTLLVSSKQIVSWVEEFCREHNVISGSMDRFPYTPTADEVFIASKGRIYPAEYKMAQNIVHKNDQESGENYFQVNRTWILDQVQKHVKRHSLFIEGYASLKEMIKEHLQNMVRDEQPEVPAIWRKLDKEDHFFHAIAFFLFSYKLKEYLDAVNAKDADQRTCISILAADLPAEKPGPRLIYGQEMLKGGFSGERGIL